MFYGASPDIFKKAYELRQKLTPSEEILWKGLKGKQLGVKFRRQHPIHNYIADFYCHEKKLVIEVDGGYHLEPEQKENDKLRSEQINELGVSIIRFTNEEVLTNIEHIITKIKQEIS